MTGSLNRLLLGRIAKHVLAVLLLVEAIFLSESLTGLLESVLSYDAGTVPLGTLLLLTSPEIFDFALPLATVTGVYLSVFSAREKNELVVCAAAGVPPGRIAAAALLAGAAGCAASLAVAGFVAPLAERATRSVIWSLQTAYVLEQLDRPAGGLMQRAVGGWSVVSAGAHPNGGGRLLIRHPVEDGTWRVSLADGWTAKGPDAAGNYTMVFNGTQLFQSADVLQALKARTAAKAAESPGARPKLTSGHATSVSVPVASGALIGLRDTTLGLKELTLAGMVAQAELGIGSEEGREAAERLGEIVGRALLCPLAALFALAGVSAARPGLPGYLALPGAAAAVMAADAALQALLRPAAESGFPTLAAWALVVLAGTVGAAAALLRLRPAGIFVPAFGRA